MKSYMPKQNRRDAKWVILDAKGRVLGRLATQIANLLMGKGKPTYSPHVPCGDHVIVINAKDIEVTGRKAQQKVYRKHTGFPGGFKEFPYERILERKPEEIITKAVKRMLPHNNLGRQLLKNLRVFRDANHTHQAQQPVEIK